MFTPAKSGWTGDSGKKEKNNVSQSFILSFAGSIGVNSLTEYGSIPALTYNYKPGCGDNGNGDVRVLWGNGSAPTAATSVQF